MASKVLRIKRVEETKQYYHVVFREPEKFKTERTPDWAANVANSVATGAQVRVGPLKTSNKWRVQSVLIPNGSDRDRWAARRLARQIQEKIEKK